MFSIGAYAVCPGHGVGQICDIEERVMGSEKKTFYIIRILANGMTVMVPTDSETGIRGLEIQNFPHVIELSFINKKLIQSYELEKETFPISGLDTSNKHDAQDIDLFWVNAL